MIYPYNINKSSPGTDFPLISYLAIHKNGWYIQDVLETQVQDDAWCALVSRGSFL